jgi:uncharacterized protein RhaS with RHS repeats
MSIRPNNVSGMPEELTEVDGELVWLARYKLWGNAVQEGERD